MKLEKNYGYKAQFQLVTYHTIVIVCQIMTSITGYALGSILITSLYPPISPFVLFKVDEGIKWHPGEKDCASCMQPPFPAMCKHF